MGANPRTKGQSGEREIASTLNAIVAIEMEKRGYAKDACAKASQAFQRNQNQSAVGGSDLSNCFGLTIEIKRQETLAVETWWRQCLEAAKRNNEVPVLIYRQNRKAWLIRTYGWLNTSPQSHMRVPMTISFDVFREWASAYIGAWLDGHEDIRI